MTDFIETHLRPPVVRDKEILEPIKPIVFVSSVFNRIIGSTEEGRGVTPYAAKSIIEAMELIQSSIVDYQNRSEDTEDAKVVVGYELPDVEATFETISMSVIKRDPGQFGQGRPGGSPVRARKGQLRELVDDPDNPGYQLAVIGYWYDNILRLTCWARTNKEAEKRALWLEQIIEEYTWFYEISGISKIVYEGRAPNGMIQVSENRFFGRSIDYFVRTERLRKVSTKQLEQIVVNFGLG